MPTHLRWIVVGTAHPTELTCEVLWCDGHELAVTTVIAFRVFQRDCTEATRVASRLD